jgi:hypothetical protein
MGASADDRPETRASRPEASPNVIVMYVGKEAAGCASGRRQTPATPPRPPRPGRPALLPEDLPKLERRS